MSRKQNTHASRLLSVKELTEKARLYAKSAKAPSTMRAYKSDWHQFENWCKLHQLQSLPASPDTVALYIADIASNHTVATITLRAQSEDTVWAFFRYPVGLTLRSSAKKLAPGVSALANGESCPIPPSGGSTWLNPWADIEAVPYWLRQIAFETPDDPPGEAIPVRTPSLRPPPCRSARPSEKQNRCVRTGYPNFNQGGWGRGFLPSRRR